MTDMLVVLETVAAAGERVRAFLLRSDGGNVPRIYVIRYGLV